MVEMRWLTRDIDYTGVTQGHQPDTERVLQYRHLLVKVVTKWYEDDVGGRVVPSNLRGEESPTEHWSEWEDVPDVRDEPQRG